MRTLFLFPLALALTLAACGDDPENLALEDAGEAADAGEFAPDSGLVDAGTVDAGMTSRCPVPRPPACQDEAVQNLRLRDVVAAGEVREEGATPGERTYIDARGGGLMVSESYVYARFTPNGLEKVAISDEQAFDDPTWHIAFRRYVIRLNGGVAGPSCVRGSRVPGTFDEVTSLDPTVMLQQEAYFTETCELVNDGSGLPNAPATVTASFWEYPGCVQMTGNIYVIELPDGRAVKMEVLSYYEPERQMECQTSGSVSRPSGSANIRIRWAFL